MPILAKHSQVGGPYESIVDYPIAASQTFAANGGHFVAVDSNNRMTLATAASTYLYGWAMAGTDLTSSATAGNTRLPVNTSLDAIYRMPVDTTLTEAQLKALIGETHDIVITGSGTTTRQLFDFDASATNVLQVVGYEYYGSASGEQFVYVKLNPRNTPPT